MANPKYDPNAFYVVRDGQRISLPDGQGGKRFLAYDKDRDKDGRKVRFRMGHRTPREVEFLVDVRKVIEPAPPEASPAGQAATATGGKKETGGKST